MRVMKIHKNNSLSVLDVLHFPFLVDNLYVDPSTGETYLAGEFIVYNVKVVLLMTHVSRSS
jgi:hypothetical protein